MIYKPSLPSLPFLLPLAVILLLVLIPITFSSGPDVSMYLMKMRAGDFSYREVELFRPAFMALGVIVYQVFPDTILGARFFLGLMTLFYLLAVLVYLDFLQSSMAVRIIGLCLAWLVAVIHPALHRPLIDFFVFMVSGLTIVFCSRFLLEPHQGWRAFARNCLYLALLAVLIWGSKPLPIFLLSGFAGYGFAYAVASSVHSGKANLVAFARLAALLACALSVLLLSWLVPTEFQTETFARQFVDPDESLWKNIENGFGFLANFGDAYIRPIFGSYWLFFAPFAGHLVLARTSQISQMFVFLLLAHFPMAVMLGALGLRPFQAVTLYATWVFAGLALLALAPRMVKAEGYWLRWAMNTGAVLALVVYALKANIPDRIGLPLQKDVARLDDLNAVVARLNGHRLYTDFGFNLNRLLQTALSESEAETAKLFRQYRRVLETGQASNRIRVRPNQIIFHQWAARSGVSESSAYVDLLYRRGQTPVLNYFSIDLDELDIEPGDVLHLDRRWYDVRMLLERQFFRLEHLRGNYYRVSGLRERDKDTAYVHASIAAMANDSRIELEPNSFIDFDY